MYACVHVRVCMCVCVCVCMYVCMYTGEEMIKEVGLTHTPNFD